MAALSPSLGEAGRIVVKIGSALLVDPETGALRENWLAALAEDIARVDARGQSVLLVSSGAIALGSADLGLPVRPPRVEDNQAAAALGQIRLAHAYQEALARHDVRVAQILLTIGDTEQRRRYLNARGTLTTLLARRIVPVINENDSVATEEIRFGDNDRLAARVAAMIEADTLVLLSDIDGLYTGDPRGPDAVDHVPVIEAITPAIEAMAGRRIQGMGSGGMITKLQAARIATGAGCRMVIADGTIRHPLRAIEDGGRCSWFLAEASPSTARKRWIAGSLQPRGAIAIDAGAARALRAGKSLLPAGVTEIEGGFERGDAVIVRGADGAELARGLIAYGAADARRIIGRRSGEIESILGYRGREEMIHRDDLVVAAMLE